MFNTIFVRFVYIQYIDTSWCLAFDAFSMIDFDFDKENNYCNNALFFFSFLSFPIWAFHLDHLQFCSSSLNIALRVFCLWLILTSYISIFKLFSIIANDTVRLLWRDVHVIDHIYYFLLWINEIAKFLRGNLNLVRKFPEIN